MTFAVTLAGKMSPFLLPGYWVAQLFGGFVGSMLVRASLRQTEFVDMAAGATLLATDDRWYQLLDTNEIVNILRYQGFIVETILTMILTQTVLNAAVDTDNNVLAPLAIGLTVSLDVFGAGSISGGISCCCRRH